MANYSIYWTRQRSITKEKIGELQFQFLSALFINDDDVRPSITRYHPLSSNNGQLITLIECAKRKKAKEDREKLWRSEERKVTFRSMDSRVIMYIVVLNSVRLNHICLLRGTTPAVSQLCHRWIWMLCLSMQNHACLTTICHNPTKNPGQNISRAATLRKIESKKPTA